MKTIGTYEVTSDVAKLIESAEFKDLHEAMTNPKLDWYIPADSPCGRDCQKAFSLLAASRGTGSSAYKATSKLHEMLRPEDLSMSAKGVVRLVQIYMFG